MRAHGVAVGKGCLTACVDSRKAMSLPLENPATHESLSTRPTPEIWYVDESDVQTQPGAVRVNRAHHSVLSDMSALPGLLCNASQKADAASKDLRRREAEMRGQLTNEELAAMHRRTRVIRETERAQHHLWEILDPALADKSAAVKAMIQKFYFDQLFYVDHPLVQPTDDFAEWVRLAEVVAKGMSDLFAHGTKNWDVGLVRKAESGSTTHWVVAKDEDGNPQVPLDAWKPFMRYDRSVANPAYAGCFLDETQRMRSRISLEGASDETVTSWKGAQDAHWRMLQIEAASNLFDPNNPYRKQDGMDAHFIGGLFLLTSVADNFPKRTALFGYTFWLLRVWHFALERNTGMKMAPFSVDYIANGPRIGRRQNRPDPLRSYCWLDNALQVIVSLKVLIFYRLRHHAYDLFFNRAKVDEVELGKRFRIDRHDVEQSKNHWLPASREASAFFADSGARSHTSSKETSPVLGPSNSSSPETMSPLHLDDPTPPIVYTVAVSCPGPSFKSRLTRLDALAEALTKHHKASSQPLMPKAYVRLRIASALTAYEQHIRALRMCTCSYKFYWINVRSIERHTVETVRAKYRELTRSCNGGAPDASNAMEIEKLLNQFDLSPLSVAQKQLREDAVVAGKPMHRGSEAPPLSVTSYETWDALFGGPTSGSEALCNAERCAPDTGLADIEVKSYEQRSNALKICLGGINAVNSPLDVGLPVEATAMYLPSEQQLKLEHPVPTVRCASIDFYKAHLDQNYRNAIVMEKLVAAAEKAMIRVVKQCLMECLAFASLSHATPAGNSAATLMLRLPNHIQRDRDGVVCDVLHRLLALARHHKLLRVTEHAARQPADVFARNCVVEWDTAKGILTLGEPADYLKSHWIVFATMLEACVRAEPWLRDQRRRRTEGLLLSDDERRIRISHGGHLIEDLTANAVPVNADAIADKYVLHWPPTHITEELATIPRMKTMLTWSWDLTIELFGSTSIALPSTSAQPVVPYSVDAPAVCKCSYPAQDLKLMHSTETCTTACVSVVSSERD